MPSASGSTIRTSIAGSGLPTVSARNGLKSFSVIAGARLRAAVAVADGNAEVVEKLQRRGLRESAADKKRAQLAAEGFVNLAQKRAAQARMRAAARERAIRRR